MLRRMLAAAWLVVLVAPALAANTDVIVKRDIAYGELPRQKLDIYMPNEVTATTPVLVFFYGGVWRAGATSNLSLEGESFAKAGVIFVAPDYRLRPAVFPQFVEDSALAVSFVWREMRTADGSPSSLFVGGWSVGAYNAAMVSINQHFLAADGVPTNAISGFIGLAGPYEGGTCGKMRCPSIFPEAERSRWKVADFMDKSDPPMLLIDGQKENYIARSNLEGLASAAKHVGVRVTTLVVPDGTHGTVLTGVRETGSTVRSAIDAFMASTPKR